MSVTDGTVGETVCAIVVYLVTPGSLPKGTSSGSAHFLPTLAPAHATSLLKDEGVHLFNSGFICQRQMQSHTFLYASNFHSECDLHLIKGNNQRQRTKSPHLCSHTALSWQLQEENTMLPPVCTTLELRGSLVS